MRTAIFFVLVFAIISFSLSLPVGKHPRRMQRQFRRAVTRVLKISPEELWPIGLFVPPSDLYSLGYGPDEHHSPDFSNGLDYPDPFLLTGQQALAVLKHLYGRGELFFDDYPHARALLRNQEERRENGLDGNRLVSHRVSSPFYNRI